MNKLILVLLGTLLVVQGASAAHDINHPPDETDDDGVDYIFSSDELNGAANIMRPELTGSAADQFIGANCVVWADEVGSTLAGVVQPQDVYVRVQFELATGIEGIAVTIGKLAGSFVEADPGSDDDTLVTDLDTSLTGDVAAGMLTTYPGQALEVGERVAVRVCLEFVDDTLGGSGLIDLTGHQSFVTFRSAPPPPVIPELSTLVLTSAGIAGLAGLAFVGRRREL